MSNKYEQRFFSALKDSFVGHKIKGKSGYVNLLDLKQQYFAEIEPFIRKEIDEKIDEDAREELFEKLYSFFDCYLNETGTVFFANSQLHKNLYERVYSDRDDVTLFWKTQKLYYVKSEVMYDDLETEISGLTYAFDASDIKHAKGNEKKSLVFYLVDTQQKKLIFKVRYQQQTKFDRLKEYLNIENNDKTKDYLLENYASSDHGNINIVQNNIDRTVFTRKGDLRDCLYINNEEDSLNTVKVEFSPHKIEHIYQYCIEKNIICTENEIKKAFHVYKKQNEVDYFIHKDADSFLKEQFDIYMYNWLFNDLKTNFDEQTVTRVQNIKKIAHKVIEYIAKFENELKAIWEKPKFVRNSNYVFTLDRLFPIKVNKEDGTEIRDFTNNIALEFIKKIINHKGFIKQKEEWNFIGNEWLDEKNKVLKSKWDEFINASNIEIIKNNKFNMEAQLFPFNTKHFGDIKNQIIKQLKIKDDILNGTLIKTDNWQGLNTTKMKYIDTKMIYIDPPFNTGDDFAYKDKYQDSTWLTLMSDRIELSKRFLKEDGFYWLHLDYRASNYGNILLDNYIGEENFINEIIWSYSGNSVPKHNFPRKHDNIWFYKKSNNCEINFEDVLEPYSELTLQRYNHEAKDGKKYKISALANGNQEIIYAKDGKYPDAVWSIPVPRAATEIIGFKTQKPIALLDKIIKSSTKKKDRILDYFSGSGTTLVAAQVLNRNWLGMEMGEHFHTKIIPRLMHGLIGSVVGKFKEQEWENQSGGIFKYYELEQYEDVLSRAKYQWQEKKGKKNIEQYSFMQDQKFLDALEIDYGKKNAKVVFENLYPDVDIAETLSNLSGKPIKEIADDYCVLVDRKSGEEMKIVYDEMTFEKYPWIKPLIWWHSK